MVREATRPTYLSVSTNNMGAQIPGSDLDLHHPVYQWHSLRRIQESDCRDVSFSWGTFVETLTNRVSVFPPCLLFLQAFL